MGIDAGDERDPRSAAREARLRYVRDDEPGLSRRRCGRGFLYLDADGQRVTDPSARSRVASLAIPPAWEEVWICRDGRGHLQATGRDAAGRKQYLYHPRWREVRDLAKFEHLTAFGTSLPAIRRRLRRDLKNARLGRRKVTAAIVKLMDATLVRVGNSSYAKANGSFGLTTLREEHARASGDAIDLAFRGKGGAEHEISLRDQELAEVVRSCQEIPGYELFRYLDEDGEPRSIDSSDVNEYLREVTSRDVTAKDFRTWGGTVLTARELHGLGCAETATARKRQVVGAVRTVAAVLANTPAVCRRAYVHPLVLERFLDASFPERYGSSLAAARRSRPRELRVHEAATLRFLEGEAG